MIKKHILLLVLCLYVCSARAAQVDTLEIASTAMSKTLKAGIVTPESYKKKKNGPFPVLYLLHGYSGDFHDWLTKTPDKNLLAKLADKYQMIIVAPDGGFSGWYLDSPLDPANQYETFITKELVQLIDSKYRTNREKNSRFISGLSMGGHGALYLSSRHPELYLAAGSMSGAVDLSAIEGDILVTGIEPILGPKADNLDLYKASSVVYLVPQLKASGLKFIIDCGVNDFLIEANRELHRRMVYEKVPHDYVERPGAHTWPYWGNALEYHLLFFQKARTEALAGNMQQ